MQKDKDIFLKTDLKSFSGITLKKAGNMLDKEARKYILDILDIPCIYFGEQVHSANIRIIEDENDNFFKRTDGLITFKKNVFLGVFVADCYPVFFEGENFTGIIHCGFRGIKEGIIENFFKVLSDRKVNISKVNAFIGAGICRKDYWLDLKSIIKAKLELFSINSIKSFDICTYEDTKFFSLRRGDADKRNLALIGRC